MQKNQSDQGNQQIKDELEPSQQNQQKQSLQNIPSVRVKNQNKSASHLEILNPAKKPRQKEIQKQQQQEKLEVSLQRITIKSPLRRKISYNSNNNSPKRRSSPSKRIQKIDTFTSKQRIQPESNSKINSQTNMKSTTKSIKTKKINKPFYEETFYITGMKQNYLLLLSDTNQVLQFPVGMFTTHGEESGGEQNSNQGYNKSQHFHLMKNIKIGQPIKIKLEFDFLRQDKDQKIFHSVQKNLHQQYAENNQQVINQRTKQFSLKRSK